MATQSLSTRGFSRDRTATFASIRQREHVHKHSFVDERDSARLLGAEGGGNGLSDGLSGVDAVTASVAPAWVDTQEEIRTDMAIIKDKMGELTRIHKTALKPTFDDTGDSNQQMIEVMTREITQDFRKAERKLKSLAAQSNAENSRLIKNVQQSIAAELQTLSQDFRKQQKGYLQRLRKQQEVTALSPTFGGPSLLDDNGDFDSGFTESQILKSRESENLVVEREKDIQTIVRSVEELATIMRDLSVLVIDQGSVVDRIDYNMEQVATHVEEGVKELVKAEKHQKSSRMMLCIMFLFCACILMIMVVMFQKLM
jgi:syntaxin 16